MKILLTTFLAVFSLNSYACSCDWNMKLEEIVESSESIFVAKVLSQKAVEKYAPGDLMTLDVKLKVIENLKGKTKRIYHGIGYEWSSSWKDGAEFVKVGGCHYAIQEGDRYLVFYREEKPIELDKCAQDIWKLSEESDDSIEKIKSILKSSNNQIQPTPKVGAAD